MVKKHYCMIFSFFSIRHSRQIIKKTKKTKTKTTFFSLKKSKISFLDLYECGNF